MNSMIAIVRRTPAATLFTTLLLISAGCSSSDQPELVPVRGRVTLDGQPLADAYVVFQSESGGRGSRAITHSDGGYELTYLRDIGGVRPGKHRVYISTAIEGRPHERLPRKYNKETILVATVPDAGGEIDFSLDSK
jgi:hypothetical protein